MYATKFMCEMNNSQPGHIAGLNAECLNCDLNSIPMVIYFVFVYVFMEYRKHVIEFVEHLKHLN